MSTAPGARQSVVVDGRTLSVTNLDKVLFPASGTTKAEIIAYYVAIAPELLRQLADRPVTRIRWPNGIDGASFFEKNMPAGPPDWVRTVVLETPGSARNRERLTFPLVDEMATLVWLSNLAALELHTPQWRVDAAGAPLPPDRLVVDLDPGAPAGLAECARVALWARAELAGLGLTTTVPVTSGSKGMQVYAALPGDRDADEIRDTARAMAQRLEREHPALVVSSMTKSVRRAKVFVDWSQNTAAKTTITPYSLRGKHREPFVAAPRTWAEIEESVARGEALTQLTPAQVLSRRDAWGDLAADVVARSSSG